MMKKETILMALLVVLVVVSAVQAVQLVTLSSAISGGTIAKSSVVTSGSGSGASIPSSLQNLPSMVGGC